MSGKYQAYPEYTSYPEAWIGQIPSGWSVTRLKFTARINMGQSPSSEDCNDEGVGKPFLQGNAEFTTLHPVAKQYCPVAKKYALPGDLLFSVRAPVGALNEADQEYGIGRGLCAITPMESVGSFMWWVLQTAKQQLNSVSTGSTFESVSAEQVENLSIVLPSTAEQRTIAAFLDHETARIDRLIEKQQRLIELLKEKRQAVISHAVTKGLDPNVPMKDSGVEWLGQVPAHWDISQLRYLCQFIGGGTPSKDNPDFWSGDIPWVSPKDMKKQVIGEAIDNITMEAVRHSSTKLIPVRAILVVVRGMILAHSVPVAITSAPVTINQDMKAMLCNSRIEPNYLLLCLNGLKSNILDLVDSSAHGTKCLRTDQFVRLEIPVPPIEEQLDLVNEVTKKLNHTDNIINAAYRSIELAEERRTALISAAVTGKIDVRNWQPDSRAQAAESDLPMAAEQAAEYRVQESP